MPIINGVKYACEPCMRGHRSSKCTHEDRLLVRVRKPGRPLSSCPHLPTGAGGTTTFVDANGARLDDTTPTHDGTGGTPCGCMVTSLAIPKVAACACSHPQFPSSATTPAFKSSSFELCIYPHQHSKARVSSPPTSPASPAAVYNATSDSSGGRISKITKKRKKSISVSGEAILQIVGREALLKAADQQDAIENGTTTESTTEDIHLTTAQLSSGHSCMSTGKGPGISQFQSKETVAHHDSSNAIFNNTVFWGQDNWRSAPILRQPAAQPVAQPVALQHPKPCFNSCGPKPAQLVPTVAHSHQLAQSQAPLPLGLPQGPSFHPMFHESMQHMQPIATTIYTYPNGYTTVNNPLTPQELRMLQATGGWSSGAAAAWSGLGVGATGNGMDAEYACSCGPGCECLGCAAHPFNTSTVNFVKDMRTMMYSGRHGVPPRRPQVAERSTTIHGAARQTSGCCGGGAQQRNSIVMVNPASHPHSDPNSPRASVSYRGIHNHQGFEHMSPPHQQMSPPPPPPLPLPLPQQYASSPHSLQQIQNIGFPQSSNIPISNSPLSRHSVSPLTNCSRTPQGTVRPHHCRPTAPLNVSSPTYTSSSSPDPTNGGDDTETEQNTASPSAYFHIDYPLGLCSESELGCLCGDDCACIGCILHGNNMPGIGTTLNEPIESEAPTTESLTSGGVSTASRGCCGGGTRINFSSENRIEAGSAGGPQGMGLSNGATIHNPQPQSNNGHASSNIHQRPQIHPFLEGIHDQEVADGESVYVWA